MVQASTAEASVPWAKPLPLGSPEKGAWTLLRDAAMATGAFPIFLAPRMLERDLSDYTPPMWQPMGVAAAGDPPPIEPSFPKAMKLPFCTLNVDGGVTNNDPFNFAHDYLASLREDGAAEKMNPPDPLEADSAVLTVAPFPTREQFDPEFDCAGSSSIFSVLSRLFNALVTQSRFFGESLAQIMTGMTFSRFVIAPTDDTFRKGGIAGYQPQALQCASLGAFGGFFARGFRAHDYALGRRNCQQFLRRHFILPAGNPLHAEALGKLDPERRAEVLEKFGQPAPKLAPGQFQAAAGQTWLPVIPLCGEALAAEERLPARAATSTAALKEITQPDLPPLSRVAAAHGGGAGVAAAASVPASRSVAH